MTAPSNEFELARLRRRVDLSSLNRGSGPTMLLVSLAGGGGTERHVRELAFRLENEGIRAIVLRPIFEKKLRLTRLAIPDSPNLDYPVSSVHSLLAALRELQVVHVHIHHLLGYSSVIFRILQILAVPYDVTVHDYFMICPRIHLWDRANLYCGEPDPNGCNTCLAENGHLAEGWEGVTAIRHWRARHAEFLRKARRVFVPDADVGERLGRYFSALEFRIRPHFAPREWPVGGFPKPAPKEEPITVAVIGLIHHLKGSSSLLGCVQDAANRSLPIRFTIFGITDRDTDFREFSNVAITGEYREEDLSTLLLEHAPRLALFLSTVPETYSYTLSAAFSAGLYPIGPELGAIGRRIRTSGFGEVFPIDSSASEINDRILAAVRRGARIPLPVPTQVWRGEYANLLQDYYELPRFPESNEESSF